MSPVESPMRFSDEPTSELPGGNWTNCGYRLLEWFGAFCRTRFEKSWLKKLQTKISEESCNYPFKNMTDTSRLRAQFTETWLYRTILKFMVESQARHGAMCAKISFDFDDDDTENKTRDAINETSFLSTLIEQSLYQHKIFMVLITYRSHIKLQTNLKGNRH
ncbi:hypothetical protein WN51_09465 [Melipona quadrifasciata]|uniref:Uncharacterized protein n=1 Tax=Melipona quadrifasciata TaxID=166423 RepID=A0A0M9A7L3_9HYME|nr:hypothetical protein WN51_09465 [Melipona quadrifasciata]